MFNTTPPMIDSGVSNVMVGMGFQRRVVEGPGCWVNGMQPPGVCRIGVCRSWNISPPANGYVIQTANTFQNWYNTAAGLNMEIPNELLLTETAVGSNSFVYDTNAFFPIDNQGFGNTPGQAHNYHFTTEAHVTFEYKQGALFTFRGDDDLWIFVNDKLALDVGGAHQALEGTINFDAQAAALGIQAGGSYKMDIFHAERQTTESNFRIETNIKCFVPVVF